MSESNETAHPDFWKKCNICKAEISYSSKYWVCNVSTCNRKRVGLAFCNVSCWDAHLPDMKHREAWAEERRSPSHADWVKILAGELEESRPKKEEKEISERDRIKPPPFSPKVVRRNK